VAAVDEILNNANIPGVMSISASPVYTWAGFCQAVQSINAIPGKEIFLGEGDSSTGEALANIAGLLAQCAWESGGDAPFSACDENNYRKTATAPCTQRSDGELYHSLTTPPACYVDPNMHMTAETWASWTDGPMECKPGTVTEKCCWWGRGAIQTTGPHNYRALQDNVVSKIPNLNVDLCTNPEAMCQNDELKWMGAMFYWTNNVQVSQEFKSSLKKFVAGDFSKAASTENGADFPSGTGGVVNNGYWASTPHENGKRVALFDKAIAAMKAAGMKNTNSILLDTDTPLVNELTDADWAEQKEDIWDKDSTLSK